MHTRTHARARTSAHTDLPMPDFFRQKVALGIKHPRILAPEIRIPVAAPVLDLHMRASRKRDLDVARQKQQEGCNHINISTFFFFF